MRVFVTGATGFIGSRIVPELLNAGHRVLGVTRSEAGMRWLEAIGAEPYRGTLEEPDGLARGAAETDGVIHTAFDHDFARFVENCEKDRRVITALASALAGSNRPLIITSGTGIGSVGPGRPAIEKAFDQTHPNPRIASEEAGKAALEKGVSVSVVRLPQVHDTQKQGLITPLIAVAREKRLSAYVDNGANRWPAAHVTDVARLYRLALEQHEAGARWHAVDEEGVSARAIAEAVGEGLGIPTISLTQQEAEAHFGWLAMFTALDMPASSAWTRRRLGWTPTGPDLLSDLRAMDYSAAIG